jgi:CBS-domain-containing membrane protein
MSAPTSKPGSLTLRAASAADLLTPNLISIRGTATVREALDLLIDRGIHALPVIDEAGHPQGVVSGSDILIHERNRPQGTTAGADGGSEITQRDEAKVADIMTPAIFSVQSDATAAQVVEQMSSLNVYRLFVVDQAGVLIGVISALDIIRHLK